MSQDAGDLLDEQLLLLKQKKAVARELLDRGRSADEVLAHEIANDLAGIRFVIRAALNGCAPGPRRDELEALELEAREIFREVVRPASERRAPDGIGGHFVSEIADQLIVAS